VELEPPIVAVVSVGLNAEKSKPAPLQKTQECGTRHADTRLEGECFDLGSCLTRLICWQFGKYVENGVCCFAMCLFYFLIFLCHNEQFN